MDERIAASEDWSPGWLADGLARVRGAAPRVQCLTNDVALVLTTNLLLATGADVRLTGDPVELPDFIAGADAVLINLGMMTAARRDGAQTAANCVQELEKPWVMDPTFISSSDKRRAFAHALVDRSPSVLRGNPAELDLVKCDAARVVMVTGATDHIKDANGISMTVTGGHPFMAMSTAMGCAGGGLTAACLGAGFSPFEGAMLSSAAMKAAGARAGTACAGPGGFPAALVDAIHSLSEADFAAHITVETSGENNNE